jgi:hypothetical protein
VAEAWKSTNLLARRREAAGYIVDRLTLAGWSLDTSLWDLLPVERLYEVAGPLAERALRTDDALLTAVRDIAWLRRRQEVGHET